jgi:hypothetical protein
MKKKIIDPENDILSISGKEICEEALQGNTLAIIDMLKSIVYDLELNGKLYDYEKIYLIEVLKKVIDGEEPSKAFKLKRKGPRSQWTLVDKRAAVYIAQQLIKEYGYTQELAFSKASEIIEQESADKNSVYAVFREAPPSEETLKAWYHSKWFSSEDNESK